jgi:hypothetical protein
MIDGGLHVVDANAIFMLNSVWKLRPHGFYIIGDIVANNENLQRFGEFARSSSASGALIKVPSPPITTIIIWPFLKQLLIKDRRFRGITI